MGLGTEILFLMVLGLVFLGPKQMHALLRRVAKAKAQFDHAASTLKATMAAELEHPGSSQDSFKN